MYLVPGDRDREGWDSCILVPMAVKTTLADPEETVNDPVALVLKFQLVVPEAKLPFLMRLDEEGGAGVGEAVER